MKVAVLGAGVCGLAAAKAFLQAKHEVVVFEASDDLGGVWAPRNHYVGLATQCNGNLYTYPSFPPPKGPAWERGVAAGAEDVYRYLVTFAAHYAVDKAIRFNTRVTGVAPAEAGPGAAPGAGGWVVTSSAAPGGEAFDYVVCALGTFSKKTELRLEGEDAFVAAGGKVLHSSDLKDLSTVRGKRVVVVGSGKSGMDCAALCGEEGVASSVTHVMRTPVWALPRNIGPPGKQFNIEQLLAVRFPELLAPSPEPSRLKRVFQAVFGALLPLHWGQVMSGMKQQLQLERLGMVPDTAFPKALCSVCTIVAPDTYHTSALAGRITPRVRVAAERFSPGCLHLDDGSALDADVVVLASGWQEQHLSVLPPGLAAELVDGQSGALKLYRRVLPIEFERFAFLGLIEVPNHPLAAEVASELALADAEGRYKRRPKEEQLAWVRRTVAFSHARFGWNRGAPLLAFTDVLAYPTETMERILGELGVHDFTLLSRFNPFMELVGVHTPQDWAPVLARIPK